MAKKRKAVPSMKRSKRRIRLMVIPEPEENTRSVLVYTGEGSVIMKGPGNVIMECGNCGVPLVEGVAVNKVQDIVLKCPKCGQFNETFA